MALADNVTLIRFLHVLSGIVWIGMLYFFNLVNLPLLKFSVKKPYEANMAEKASGHIIVKTLFWFRWGAAATVLFGLLLLYIHGPEYKQLMSSPNLVDRYPVYAIMFGTVLALIMAFNVWFVIWPRQKKILANNKRIAAGVTDDEKKAMEAENAPLVKVATLASRTNTWLSIPMLWGMIFGAHGNTIQTADGWRYPIIFLVLLLLAMFAYSKSPKAKTA